MVDKAMCVTDMLSSKNKGIIIIIIMKTACLKVKVNSAKMKSLLAAAMIAKMKLSRCMTKLTKWPVRLALTQIRRASAQSDQSFRCALIRSLRTQGFFMRTATTLIRLGGCPGWSESWLGAQIVLLVLSCGGSLNVSVMQRLFSRKNMIC